MIQQYLAFVSHCLPIALNNVHEVMKDVLLAAPALQVLEQMSGTMPKVLADHLCKAEREKGKHAFSRNPHDEFKII